uniref:Uncharacterized protein n=1 Tax=Cajanus cajan TaxID=3821 RepID=A0A151SKL4_CAJCA|nr:hypothetical protein KK1_001552 [Cajanus cajan]KYP55360.1 hypothetical protein KK1_001571 [Cajanus cajan]
MKSLGVFFPQTLSNKLNLTGTLRLMPNTLALRAVQRHTAASRSARPSMREQHGVFGGFPRFTFTKPSRLAHTPNLRVSLGQVPDFVEGGFGTGGCFGTFGGGLHGTYDELTTVKKRMLRDKRSAALEAISQ